MAGGNLSPRQKMINMMYLVLTALLALNVSKTVLDAFVIVSEGLEMQKGNLESKNAIIYGEFANQKNLFEKSNKEYYDNKIKPWSDKTTATRQKADEVVNFIETMKKEMIAEIEGVDKATADTMRARDIKNMDNYDKPTHFFGTNSPPGDAGKAHELKVKLEELREFLIDPKSFNKGKVDQKLVDVIKSTLNTSEQFDFREKKLVAWEMFYFYHLPVPAAITELTKWQNNVRSVEGEKIKYYYDQIAATSFKFDVVQAQVIPNSNVVFAGNQFEAKIFLGAYNSNSSPKIIVGGSELSKESFVDGMGVYKTTAQGEGEKTVTGSIKMEDPITGEIKDYPFETKYQVSKPMMTVSPDKMNVFYRGLDNPITISVPGVAPNQIIANCTGCTSFTGSNGKYTVKPGTGNKAQISVSVKLADKTQTMGTAEFRIKRIPDPTIKFSNKKSGEGLTQVEASSGGALIPMLEDFDFDVYAVIQGFNVSFDPGTGSIYDKQVTGNQIPSDIAGMIKKIPRGKKLYFDNIKVKMPDGTVRGANAIYPIR